MDGYIKLGWEREIKEKTYLSYIGCLDEMVYCKKYLGMISPFFCN